MQPDKSTTKRKANNRWVISGGGTGGHIYPAIAIATAARTKLPDLNCLFIGASYGSEKILIPRHGYQLVTVFARPFPRRLISPSGFICGAVLIYGIIQSLRILTQIKPQVVLGTGGYASICALVSGKLVKSKLVLFESNCIPGRTNKVLAKLADLIVTGFPETVNFFPRYKTIFTGTPVRIEVRSMDKTTARQKLGLLAKDLLLLVFGGSQGAKSINETVWDALPYLLSSLPLNIIHLCGTRWEGEANNIRCALSKDWKPRYQAFGYRDDLPLLLHAADLSVSRAGSSSIAELLVAGAPSILIPYPFSIYDHQKFNALSVVKRGAGQMILDADLSGQLLAQKVIDLFTDRHKLEQMRSNALSIAKPFAAEEIVDLILSLTM